MFIRRLLGSKYFWIVAVAVLTGPIFAAWYFLQFKAFQDEALNRFRASGASVTCIFPINNAVYPRASNPKRNHPWVEAFARLFGRTAVPIGGMSISGDFSAKNADLLGRLTDLWILALSSGPTLDAPLLQELSKCPRLQVLLVIDSNITENGFASFSKLPDLRVLQLLWRNQTECPSLIKLPTSLREFKVLGSFASDCDLLFSGCPNLESLDLSHTSLGDETIKRIAEEWRVLVQREMEFSRFGVSE